MAYFRIFIIIFLLTHCKDSEKVKVLKLNGDWSYKLGFDIDWLPVRKNNSGWKKISLPANLSKELNLGEYSGYITLQQELPESLNTYLKNGKPIAINAGRVLDVSYFYFNKTLIGQLGSSSPYSSGAMRPFIKDIPFNDLSPENQNTITIVLYGNGKYPLQFLDSIEVGESNSIYKANTKKEIFAFFFISIYIIVGLYHILLASKRRKDLYNFYFGLFCILVSIYFFISNTYLRDAVFHSSVEIHRKLEHVFLFTLTPSLLLFLVQFFERKHSRIAKSLAIFCATLSVFTIIFPLPVMRVCSMFWQASNIFVFPYMIFYLIQQIRKGNKNGMYLIIGLTIVAIAVAMDIATSLDIIHTPHISSFSFLLFVMGIAGIMANRFMHVTNEVEVLNSELEQKVEDRTRKLRESLDEIQKLKVQQDGDYYLTSLLINPLSGNFILNKKSDIKTETLIRQKKHFQFKKKVTEIGGDICIIDEIVLHKLSYTVFLNGDAMGKSIQGAGGSLVLGTVFKSILERNRALPGARKISPEQWMKESFRELQNVFVSFNGSMLISAMFGIIDNRNGTMYYINAEHPYTILIRDGNSMFIDADNHNRKIGIESKYDPLKVHVFQLRYGDIIIAGSDGRDDLLIDKDSDGIRIINEDENLFLQIAAEANGDLTKIEELLLARGELTDDFSLLKIFYSKEKIKANDSNLIEIQKKLKNCFEDFQRGARVIAISNYEKLFNEYEDLELLHEIINSYIEKKEYAIASKLLTIYCDQNPANSALLYLNSFVKKKNREYEQAIILGERFRIREPMSVKNLINLADTYRFLNKLEKSKKFLTRAFEIDPQNKQALKLQESFSESNFS